MAKSIYHTDVQNKDAELYDFLGPSFQFGNSVETSQNESGVNTRKQTVIGGELLSRNYVPGVSGWKISDEEIEALKLTAVTGSIAGYEIYGNRLEKDNLSLSSDGYIALGNPYPTSYGNNVGVWLGYDTSAKFSLYSDANNFLQWDGSKLVIKAQNFELDASGNITGSNVNFTNGTFSGVVTATSGTFTGTVNANAGNFSGNITSSATITGGTIQTGFSGQRWRMGSDNYLRGYDSGGNETIRGGNAQGEFVVKTFYVGTPGNSGEYCVMTHSDANNRIQFNIASDGTSGNVYFDYDGNVIAEGEFFGVNATLTGKMNVSTKYEIAGVDVLAIQTWNTNLTSPTSVSGPSLNPGGDASPYANIGMRSGGLVAFVVGNSQVSYVNSSGTYVTGSDRRLKNDIEPINEALSLEALKSIDAVTYVKKDSGLRGTGFIAQDVEEFFPDVVDNNGDDGYKFMDYKAMTAILWQAVKAQGKEIESLKDIMYNKGAS